MRIVLIASAPPPVTRLSELLCEMGHTIPSVVAIRRPEGRYGPDYPAALHRVLPAADLLFVRSGEHLGKLLRAYEPDLGLCETFSARIPDDALAAPRHGIINGHPGRLPRYRGPNPLGWALRNGDAEIGMTFHRMTSAMDGGAILAQGTFTIATDGDPVDAVQANRLWGPLLAQALARIEAGDPGDPQDETQAGYAGVFEPEYIEVDWTRPAREIHDQTRAWRLAPPVGGARGPQTTLGGQRVRLLRTQLDDRRGGEPVPCGDGPLWLLQAEPT